MPNKTNDSITSFTKQMIKIIIGVLAVALIISGITIYFSRQKSLIVYEFNPEHAYVYTDYQSFFTLDYTSSPKKSLTLFTNGFHPTCIFGCQKDMNDEEARDAIIRSSGKDEDSKPSFAYLKPGEEITINFDMKKGDKVKDRYPYADRLIVDLEEGGKKREISITAEGYEFGTGSKAPKGSMIKDVEFTYDQTFVDCSVFSLAEPVYVSKLKFKVNDNLKESIGLREASLYLERSGYNSLVSSLKSEITEKTTKGELTKPQAIRRRLEQTYLLDPYSPMTDYLIAHLALNSGDYESGLKEVNGASEKLKKYRDFLKTPLKIKDTYEQKARLARGLGQWKVAIKNMKKVVPQVDQNFLSEVFLKKYEESGKEEDLRKSYYHGFLAVKEIKRSTLEVLEKYRGNRGLLNYGLEYLESELGKEDGSYLLPNGKRVSPYLVEICRALLNLWLGKKDSSLKSISALEQIQGENGREKSALIWAIKSKLYRMMGEKEKAEELRAKAEGFFDNYVSLYEDWKNFMR